MKRFWEKVNKTDDCWEWTAYKNVGGYGVIKIDKKLVLAHRAALILEGVDIPSGMCVCHTCDNRACVNPDHLWIGTQKDNMRDAASKGRLSSPPFVGSDHPNAKLSEDDIISIRSDERPYGEIIKDYPVSKQTIGKIKNNLKWKHVVRDYA